MKLAVAQQEEAPAGPPLKPAPAFSHWTVSYNYPDEREAAKLGKPSAAAAASNRTQTVAVTKTQDMVHEEIINTLSGKVDIWHVGNVQYSKATGATFWRQNEAGTSGGGKSDFDPLPALGFRDLEWVQTAPYIATIPYKGRNCHVYAVGFTGKPKSGDAAGLLKQLESISMAALIDAESRMPVEVHMNGIYRLYAFDAPPSARQTLPADLADAIKKGREGRAQLFRPAPRPY